MLLMLGASRCGLLRLSKRKQTNKLRWTRGDVGWSRPGRAQLVSPVFGGLFQGRRRMCVWPAEDGDAKTPGAGQ
ncbi:hypothetical protein CHARACLAT_026711 [Characodon lateralis]|uniref:Uncharacterized protein n=1 Tax=Characodon lateralis TaxID=208331 RepID=A0ABU7DCK9_9TELE|nr:hypothetical protein [Characodon lateralis]